MDCAKVFIELEFYSYYIYSYIHTNIFILLVLIELVSYCDLFRVTGIALGVWCFIREIWDISYILSKILA